MLHSSSAAERILLKHQHLSSSGVLFFGVELIGLQVHVIDLLLCARDVSCVFVADPSYRFCVYGAVLEQLIQRRHGCGLGP
jgi:hypothetical protein